MVAEMVRLARFSEGGPWDGEGHTWKEFSLDLDYALTLTKLLGKSADQKGAATHVAALVDSTWIMKAQEVSALTVSDEEKGASRVCSRSLPTRRGVRVQS